MVAFFFANLLSCTPISLYVEKGWGADGLKCIKLVRLCYAHAATDVTMDLAIMALPWPQLWTLQLPARAKWAVMGIFGVGFL